MNLELERKKIQYKRVEMAKLEMEFKIQERLADIKRLEENIKVQEKTLEELSKEIGG